MHSVKERVVRFIGDHIRIFFPGPALMVLFLIVVIPIIYNVYMSFQDWMIGLGSPSFVGLENYLELWQDPRFWNGVKVMFYFSALSLTIELALGLFIALYLNRDFKGQDLVHSIYIFPFAATPVAIALIWRIMLNPEVGVLNFLLESFGLPGSLWVSSSSTVIPSLVLVDVWKWTPMITLIVLAGLKSLPTQPFESARIDGASSIQIFRHITLPLIRPTLIAALVLRALDNLKEFDIIYTITQGGPGNSSETLYLYAYKTSFNFFKAGYGSAMIVIVFLIILIFNVVMNRIRTNI